MSNPFKTVQKMYDEIDNVISKYGLQIGTLTGQFKHPIEITITIEEADMRERSEEE